MPSSFSRAQPTATVSAEAAENLAEAAGKYLTFTLGPEFYGLPVLKIREIIRMIPITPVPRMPSYIKGVLNLRGKIISVIDLRSRFGLGEGVISERTCIIVVQVAAKTTGTAQVGLIVDAVEEVVNIQPGDLEETPDFGVSIDTEYILAMAKIKGKVKILLDIDRVLEIRDQIPDQGAEPTPSA